MMSINFVQAVLVVFLLFALSRVVLRFKERQIKIGEFLFWSLSFAGAVVVVVLPGETTKLAQLLGVGRGVDLIVYASIVTLFYICFRTYIQLENMRHEITELVRKLALEKKSK
jgi:hypothetical protein